MSEFVIEAFEIVDINHEATDRMTGSVGCCQLMFKHFVRVSPIGKARKRICHRHLPQPLAQAKITDCQANVFRQHLKIDFGSFGL
jgi:hypothetical protein